MSGRLRWEHGKPTPDYTAGGRTHDLPLLTCGHRAEGAPPLTSPERKWFCCGQWRRARKGA